MVPLYWKVCSGYIYPLFSLDAWDFLVLNLFLVKKKLLSCDSSYDIKLW